MNKRKEKERERERERENDLHLFVFLLFKRCQIETLVFCLSPEGNLKKTAGGNAAPPGDHFLAYFSIGIIR